MTRRSTITLGAGLAAGAVLTASATLGAAPALAAGDDGALDVVNTETVQVYTDSTGAVDSRRVYEQLTLTGDGSAEIVNPIETDGLRNLDGFGGVTTDDGTQRVDVEVDGVERLRSVSDYSGDLPLDLSVEYRLDGEPVEPGDVVGADGDLEVAYTVRNLTSAPTEVSFPDGQGGTTTKTVDVPVPMVGSLTTVTPSGFSDVRSETANLAGDGRGGTKLSFTMTLFPPIGSDTATFGYTARIADGVVPDASITALPVNPLDSPTFASAADSYQSGADTGAELVAGATEIDENVLRLRDGAGELLAGLVQLNDGADELRSGLVGSAVPGARLVANGAGELDAGLNDLKDGTTRLRSGTSELDSGAGDLDGGAARLDAGARTLAGGTGDALSGSRQLQGGLQRLSGGLDELSGQLPGAQAGITQLQQGVDLLLAGLGDAAQPTSLLGGLGQLEAGAGQLRGGLGQLRGDGSAGNPGVVGARGGVDRVRQGLAGAVASNDLENGLNAVRASFCASHPAPAQCTGLVDQILAGVAQSKGELGQAVAGLDQVSSGLGSAITALDGQLIPGADQLVGGLGRSKQGAADLKAGVGQLDAGLVELKQGVNAAVSGVFQLADGAGTAVSGSGDLTGGLSQLDGGAGGLAAGTGDLTQGTSDLQDGTGALASGASELDAGAGAAVDGSGRLRDGAGKLAEGLDGAADGSQRLADGLGEAAGKAPALEDGAGRLSEEGMSQLIAAGEETTKDYGQLVAVIGAAADRADAESMAYGAPEGAAGLTAYSYELVGDDGEGGRNVARGLGAAVLAVAGIGGLGLRRRLA